MRAPILAAALLLTTALPLQVGPARAAILDTGCDLYREEALSGGVPTQMLGDVPRAAECLVSTLADLDGAFDSKEIDDEALELLTQTTGALLRLFDLAEAGGKGATNPAIDIAREFDDARTAGVLSYGAGLENTQARMNSSLVFANLIDNSTLCVALDHLADPLITGNGRVNLLGIASLVAPYSVKENYNALTVVADYFTAAAATDATLNTTAKTVANLKKRLELSPQAADDAGLLAECKTYTMRWATGVPYALSYGAVPAPEPQPTQ